MCTPSDKQDKIDTLYIGALMLKAFDIYNDMMKVQDEEPASFKEFMDMATGVTLDLMSEPDDLQTMNEIKETVNWMPIG